MMLATSESPKLTFQNSNIVQYPADMDGKPQFKSRLTKSLLPWKVSYNGCS